MPNPQFGDASFKHGRRPRGLDLRRQCRRERVAGHTHGPSRNLRRPPRRRPCAQRDAPGATPTPGNHTPFHDAGRFGSWVWPYCGSLPTSRGSLLGPAANRVQETFGRTTRLDQQPSTPKGPNGPPPVSESRRGNYAWAVRRPRTRDTCGDIAAAGRPSRRVVPAGQRSGLTRSLSHSFVSAGRPRRPTDRLRDSHAGLCTRGSTGPPHFRRTRQTLADASDRGRPRIDATRTRQECSEARRLGNSGQHWSRTARQCACAVGRTSRSQLGRRRTPRCVHAHAARPT